MQKSGLEYGRYVPNTHNWIDSILETKLNHIADVICDIDADIIALQEVENAHTLELLTQKLSSVGCDYPYSTITHNQNSAIQVALLSRYKLIEIKELSKNLQKYDRPILEATAMVDDTYPLTLFANHWKAKSNGGVESRRINYAITLMDRIKRLPKRREYIVLGDLNSNYNEYQNINPKLNDTNSTTAINHILQTIYQDRLISKYEIISKRRGFHYNLWLELLSSDRWSYKFYGRRFAIDHIILPPTLFDGKGVDYINNSFNVFRGSYLFNKRGWINRWQYSHNRHIGRGYSDHLPIYALFDTKAFIADTPKEITYSSIEELYKIDKLTNPIILKNIVVVLKRGNSTIIKDDKRAIFIYNSPQRLKEGGLYNLTIDEIKSYNGLKEIVGVLDIEKIGEVDTQSYYLHQKELDYKDPLLQNQIFTNLVGVYRDGYLYIDNQKIPIYFKKRRFTPKDNTKLKIFYAHLGYYRRVQLVIYSQKDFKILEK